MPVGYKHSEATKRKISKKISLILKEQWAKGIRKPIMLGRHQSEYQKEVIRKRNKENNPAIKGKEHWWWKGGISSNKEYRDWQKHLHYYRKKSAFGNHTFEEWELLKKQYNYICPKCGRKEPEIKLGEDHIIPLSKGGSNNIENIQPLCRSCNCKKHTEIIRYKKVDLLLKLEM